jgi:6-pyruvoyltetrahydropterin/6-carboxytetrahydropterin synthase
MYEVTIKKSFSAAHVLKEIGGKCEDLHGHNFLVEVTVAGNALNEEDLLIDFRDLKKWINEILDHLDHKYLNEVEVFKDINPSSERIARYIYDRLMKKFQTLNLVLTVSRVTVWESDNARVTYTA